MKNYIFRLFIPLFVFLLFAFFTQSSYAVNCAPPVSGNYTLTESCAFANTVDGVDGGTGTTNTAAMTIPNAVTLTIGSIANQAIGYGSITIQRGGSIIINKGVGAKLLKGPLWMQDCNADGIPGSLTQATGTSAPDATYRRRSLMSTIASADTNDQIDATNSFAWAENVGWINFRSSTSVNIPSSGALTGYLWGENIGWISLNCSNTSSCGTVNYSVTNTSGTLSGYGWAENVGWISFNCSNTSSCGIVSYSVTIDGSGNFAGWAWGENIGWISFNCSNTSSCATVSYFVKKAC